MLVLFTSLHNIMILSTIVTSTCRCQKHKCHMST